MPLHHAVNHGIMIIECWWNLAMRRKDFPNSRVWDCWCLLCVVWFNGIFMSAVTGESALMHSTVQHHLSVCLFVICLNSLGSYVEWKDWKHPLDPNHPPILLIQTLLWKQEEQCSLCVCMCVCVYVCVSVCVCVCAQTQDSSQLPFSCLSQAEPSKCHSRPCLLVLGSKAWSTVGPVSLMCFRPSLHAFPGEAEGNAVLTSLSV